MRLTVLGSGVCEPTLRRGPSAYALSMSKVPTSADELILLDLGTGALRAALAAGLDPRRARHVLLSHVHPDHSADLVPLLFACNYAPDWKPGSEITFAGPHGLGRFLEDLEVPFPWLRPRGWHRRVHEGSLEGDGWRAEAFPVSHGSTRAVAWRFESGGRVLCYSGDSSLCEGLRRAARGADLLVCECTVPRGAEPVEGHLTADEVGQLAAEAGVARVLLTHLYPVADEVDVVGQVREHFAGGVEKAEDGCSYPLGDG